MDSVRRSVLLLLALAAVLALPAQTTVPVLTQALPDQVLAPGGATATLDLTKYFTVPGVSGQVAQFDTVLGKFNIELLASAAPLSVANFLTYVGSGAYSNSMIHRSASLNADGVSNWIVQGGGFTFTSPTVGPVSIPANAPIPLEYNLPNAAGTIAMARGTATNSATTQWFFNVNDNTTVLGASNGGGYAVFGRVLGTGMSVVNAMAAVPTYDVSGGVSGSPFTTVPLQNLATSQTSILAANLIMINSITAVPFYPAAGGGASLIGFSTLNSNATAVTASLSGSTLTLASGTTGSAIIVVRGTDVNGNLATGSFTVTVGAVSASAPVITTPPASQSVAAGATAVFNVAASGTPAPTYQWRKDGSPIAGASSSIYAIFGATAAAVGSYTVVVSNASGSVTSAPATLGLSGSTDFGRVTNLSVLTDISAAVPSFTVGTSIGGAGTSGTKSLVVRADGPSLGALGVAGTIGDPQLTLFNSSNVAIAANDNWGTPVGSGAASAATLLNAMASVGAFAFTGPTAKDAAIFPQNLAPGGYTVAISGVGGATGTALAEIYDATPAGTFTPTTPRLTNVSVLKQINTAGNLTLGFTIGGSTAKTVLIRAVGPGLAAVNVTSGTLADPQLTLYNSSKAVIAANNDWGADPQLVSAVAKVGAFPIGTAPTKDSMLLVTLAPGGYTATASGADGGGGLAIVEVYDVP